MSDATEKVSTNTRRDRAKTGSKDSGKRGSGAVQPEDGKGASAPSSEAKESAEAKDAKGEASAASAAAPAADKPKRKIVRKPLYVCIPSEYETVAITEEETARTREEKVAKSYVIEKCTGKPEVRKALERHDVDPTNFKDVLIFRANPIEIGISKQIVLRF